MRIRTTLAALVLAAGGMLLGAGGAVAQPAPGPDPSCLVSAVTDLTATVNDGLTPGGIASCVV